MNPPAFRSAAFILLLGIAPAEAGTLSDGAWRPAGCGTEPVAPKLDLHSADGYSQSLKWVKLYEDTIKTYDDCVLKEANADSRTISEWINTQQGRVKEAFDSYNADSKAAAAKFSKGK